MHKQHPLNAAYVGYVSGGARALVDTISDGPMMQEMKGSFMKGEARDKIEAPQNYGFTSVVLPAKKGKDGQITECAEAFMGFLGGMRSHPIAMVMDDRRHRPMGLKPGENAQYDDLGQMTLMRRNGLFLLSLDNEDESQSQSATPTQQAEGGGQSKKVERMVSMRHVEKKKQERPKGGTQPGGAQNEQSGGSALTVSQQATLDQKQQAEYKKREEHKHEGETVNTEIRCTKNRIEFRSGDDVVGYYDKGKKAWCFIGKIITLDVKQDDGEVETIGKTYLGRDQTKEVIVPKVVTELGPAKQVWGKPG